MPSSNGSEERRAARMPESPPEFQRMHKGLMAVAIFFFVYLIVEAIVLFPIMIDRHGWW